MDTDKLATFIHTVPLFHALGREQLEQLAEVAQERECAAGETLVNQDDESPELLIFVEGEYQAYLRHTGNGFEKDLTRLFPGDYYGAVNVIAGDRSAISIRALEAGRVIVLDKGTIDELFRTSPDFARAVCRSLAHYLRQSIDQLAAIPFVQLDSFPNLRNTVGLLPPRISRYCRSLAVARDADRVTVAMVDPNDAPARSFINDVLHQYQVNFVAISEDDFQHQATKLLGLKESVLPPDVDETSLSYIDSTGSVSVISQSSVEHVLSRSLAAAVRGGASDVHFEPYGEGGRVRLRIDGRMTTFEEDVTAQVLRQVVTRIKVMSDLDITNSRRPQDGRTVIRAGDRRVELRVSTTPCQGGENVALRLVAPDPHLENLNNLILSRPVAMFVEEIFQNPSGLVLVTGPTGAGKTTTLYAALHMLEARDHSLHIVTIEDPVEYSLPFATQIQVNPDLGLDFTRMLRTVLRQDPDVILVGEIRDPTSAAVAVEAANTGHLVLSSLHTYSALETLVRLRNLGVKPYLLASALKGVISQKLVPRLCPGCTAPVSGEDPIIGRLKELDVLDDGWSGTLVRGTERGDCPPRGESGRVGVFEVLAMTQRVRELIERSAPMSELARNLNMRSFISYARYARVLLTEGIVAPERIEEIFPRRMSADLLEG